MMQTKRQKQIRLFLRETFGPARGEALLAKQTAALDAMIERGKNRSKSQQKMLAETILPTIALYKALLESGVPDAYCYVQRYMLDVVAAQKHASTAKMELVPGFYHLYSRIFLRVMRTSDLWKSTQRRGRDYFDVTISACLWHTACAENGCEELCRLFCEADNVTYGGLRKIGFSRTKTLGCGGDCCDFHFFKK